MATKQATENINLLNKNCAGAASGPKEFNARQQRHAKLCQIYDARRQEALRNAEDEPRRSVSTTVACRIFGIFSVALLLVLIILHGSGQIDIASMIADWNGKCANQYVSTAKDNDKICERYVDLKDTFKHLHREVLHQEEALSKLESVLFKTDSIAIIGSSGIGKSLTARLLREHYPWAPNVQIFAYNMHMLAPQQKLYRIEYLLENMSQVGRNLFIIDNLLAEDYEVVQNVNDIIKNSDDDKETTQQQENCSDDVCVSVYRHTINKNATILYIFNLNMGLPYSIFEKQRELLHTLPYTTVIDYKTFDRKQLADCIRNELRLENLSLDEYNFNQILDYTDVEVSGCKSTRSQVLIYGRNEEKVKREQEKEKEYLSTHCYDRN